MNAPLANAPDATALNGGSIPRDTAATDFQKDLVSHARTTHFGLLAACFVLLLAYENPQKAEIDRAIAQGRTVAELLRSWSPAFVFNGLWRKVDQGALKTVLPERRAIDLKGLLHNDGFAALIETKDLVRDARFAAYTMRDGTSDGCLKSLGFEPDDLTGPLALPVTLREFAEQWTYFSCFTRVYFPIQYPAPAKARWAARSNTSDSLEGAVFAFPDAPNFGELRQKVPDGYRPPHLKFGLIPRAQSADQEREPIIRAGEELHLWSLKTHDGPAVDRSNFPRLEATLHFLEMPAPTHVLNVSAQQLLLEETSGRVSSNRGLELGTFARSFPDLAKWSEGVDTMDLASLDKLLSVRREQAAESLTLFGAQLPTTRLSQIGISVMLAIQAYLMLHLIQFYRLGGRASLTPPAAWIAIYRSAPALAVSWLTIVTLPGYTHWLLQKKWPDTAWDVLELGRTHMAVFAAIVSLALTVLLILLWRTKRPHSEKAAQVEQRDDLPNALAQAAIEDKEEGRQKRVPPIEVSWMK